VRGVNYAKHHNNDSSSSADEEDDSEAEGTDEDGDYTSSNRVQSQKLSANEAKKRREVVSLSLCMVT